MPQHTQHPATAARGPHNPDKCTTCTALATIERDTRRAARAILSPWVRRNLAGEQHAHETAKR